MTSKRVVHLFNNNSYILYLSYYDDRALYNDQSHVVMMFQIYVIGGLPANSPTFRKFLGKEMSFKSKCNFLVSRLML